MEELKPCPRCGNQIPVSVKHVHPVEYVHTDRTGLYIMIFIILMKTCSLADKL